MEEQSMSGEFLNLEVPKGLNKSISSSNIDYNSHERYLYEFFRSDNMSYMKFRKEYFNSLKLDHDVTWKQIELESTDRNKTILLEIDKTLILISHELHHDLHMVSLASFDEL